MLVSNPNKVASDINAFFDRDRLKAYAVVAIIFYAVSALTALGLDPGFVLGSDFMSFWTASKLALMDRASIVYQPFEFAHFQEQAGSGGKYYAFFYPPLFLLFVLPFGYLGFIPAVIVWCTTTAIAAIAAIWALSRQFAHFRHVALVMLAFPAAFIALLHGQNSFLTLTLFAGAIFFLDRSQIVSGLLFGCLAYKPQFMVLVPFVLLAGGYWVALLFSAFGLLALGGLSIAVFGSHIWIDFLNQGGFAWVTLREGLVPWRKMISAYSMLRSAGLTHSTALAFQIAIAVIAGILAASVWRRQSAHCSDSRFAALMLAVLLSSPFTLSYDYLLLLPAIIWGYRETATARISPLMGLVFKVAYVFPFLSMILSYFLFRPEPVIILILLFGIWNSYSSRSLVDPEIV